MKYSLCLTNYNRYEMLLESFAKVIDDDRIDEIVISDDDSHNQIWNQLVSLEDNPKIKLFRNSRNLGMLENKKTALSYATNDWCILFDSDNVLGVDYLDALDAHIKEFGDLKEKEVYCPDHAKPQFDFRNFSGCLFNLSNITQLISDPMGNVAFNCCNYVLNKKHFKVSENPHVKASDTAWINYRLLMEGFSFYITPNLSYEHLVHDGSGFMLDANYNMVMASQIKEMVIRESQQLNNK